MVYMRIKPAKRSLALASAVSIGDVWMFQRTKLLKWWSTWISDQPYAIYLNNSQWSQKWIWGKVIDTSLVISLVEPLLTPGLRWRGRELNNTSPLSPPSTLHIRSTSPYGFPWNFSAALTSTNAIATCYPDIETWHQSGYVPGIMKNPLQKH